MEGLADPHRFCPSWPGGEIPPGLDRPADVYAKFRRDLFVAKIRTGPGMKPLSKGGRRGRERGTGRLNSSFQGWDHRTYAWPRAPGRAGHARVPGPKKT